jgi:hypothetical protein
VQIFFSNIYQRYFIVAIQEHPEASPEVDIREEDEDTLLRGQLLREFKERDNQD